MGMSAEELAADIEARVAKAVAAPEVAAIRQRLGHVRPLAGEYPLGDYPPQPPMVRTLGLGGSDMASVMGVSPYTSPLEVYLEKVGALPEGYGAVGEPAYWGTVFEPLVLDAFEARDESGRRVARNVPTIVSAEHPWARINVDGLAYPPSLEPLEYDSAGSFVGDWRTASGLVEVKTASAWLAADWAEGEIPPHYQIQGHFYMAVTGLSWVVYPYLVGGQRLKATVMHNDPLFEAELLETGAAFWQRCLDRDEPEPGPTPAATRLLKALYPEAEPETYAIATEMVVAAVERHEQVKAAMKLLEAEKGGLYNTITAAIGTNEALYSSVTEWTEGAKPIAKWGNRKGRNGGPGFRALTTATPKKKKDQ